MQLSTSGSRRRSRSSRPGEQLGTDLQFTIGLGTVSHAAVSDFAGFADQMEFTTRFPPATVDLPVYEALRADLAASGEELLQPANLRSSPMRSWIGLYALLYMIRDARMTEFTREGISAMLDEATDVPMLGMFGDENWTPDTDHPGIFQRAGIDRWSSFELDPERREPGRGARGELRRDGGDQLRRGAVRLAVRWTVLSWAPWTTRH